MYKYRLTVDSQFITYKQRSKSVLWVSGVWGPESIKPREVWKVWGGTLKAVCMIV